MCHNLFFYSPIGEYLDCFHFFIVRKNGAINILIQVFLWKHVFISLVKGPSHEIAGS